jgi:hypothetical protein
VGSPGTHLHGCGRRSSHHTTCGVSRRCSCSRVTTSCAGATGELHYQLRSRARGMWTGSWAGEKSSAASSLSRLERVWQAQFIMERSTSRGGPRPMAAWATTRGVGPFIFLEEPVSAANIRAREAVNLSRRLCMCICCRLPSCTRARLLAQSAAPRPVRRPVARTPCRH